MTNYSVVNVEFVPTINSYKEIYGTKKIKILKIEQRMYE